MGVYKENGKYKIRLRVAGKLVRETIGPVSAQNRIRAKARINELETERDIAKQNGSPWTVLKKLDQAKIRKTFEEVAEEFMEEGKDKKPSTQRNYRSILNKYLLPRFGKKQIAAITEGDIAKFQADIAQGITARRTNCIVSMLRTLFKISVRRGYCQDDPTKNVDRKQEAKPNIDPLSEEELSIALGCVDYHYRPLYTVIAYTGARPNEILALRWSDIDWQRKEISITKGLVRGHEGLPKTAAADRVLPMLPPVELALQEQRNRGLKHIDDYIFLDKKGKPIRKHLDRIWSRAEKKAGLRHRPSYQLRHTFASLCLAKGMAPGYVAQLLGHSTLQELYRHYARWIADSSKDQENKLRAAFPNKYPIEDTKGQQTYH